MLLGRTAAFAALFLISLIAVPVLAEEGEDLKAGDIWSGFYGGLHTGLGTADHSGVFDSSEIGSPVDNEDLVLSSLFDTRGALGGAQAGFNFNYDSFVFGLEADWSYLGWSDRRSDPDAEGGGTDNAGTDIDWIASARARAGYASGQTLVFATGGLAWVNADYFAQDLDGGGPKAHQDLDGLGYVVGGGLEHAFGNGFSLRIEGLYYRFDNRESTAGLTADSDVGDFAELEDVMVARLGLTYHLNGGFDRGWERQPDGNENPWTGLYAGAHFGYGQSETGGFLDSSEIGAPGDLEDTVLLQDIELSGLLGGAQLGYNHVFSGFLVGVEADWTYLNHKDREADQDGELLGGADITDNAEVDLNWIASLRGRLGYVSNDTLFFGTAGLAWADADYRAQNLDAGPGDQGGTDLDGLGFVFGGGIEHLLTDDLSVRLEGLYFQFDNKESTAGLTTDSDPGDFAELNSEFIARLAISYHFW